VGGSQARAGPRLPDVVVRGVDLVLARIRARDVQIQLLVDPLAVVADTTR